MASTPEYMQFALGVYNATTENKIAPPVGWSFDQALWQPDRASGANSVANDASFNLFERSVA